MKLLDQLDQQAPPWFQRFFKQSPMGKQMLESAEVDRQQRHREAVEQIATLDAQAEEEAARLGKKINAAKAAELKARDAHRAESQERIRVQSELDGASSTYQNARAKLAAIARETANPVVAHTVGAIRRRLYRGVAAGNASEGTPVGKVESAQAVAHAAIATAKRIEALELTALDGPELEDRIQKELAAAAKNGVELTEADFKPEPAYAA